MTTFGLVGLGKIGRGVAEHAIELGHSVVAYDQAGVPEDLARLGVRAASSTAGIGSSLDPPRQVLVYVPAGAATESVIEEVASTLALGDVIVDGGNSHWRDSSRRAAMLAPRGIALVDAGTSGGVDGARRGACFMVGGDPVAFETVAPLLADLAVPGGLAYVGPSGAGHLSKLIHNGIEMAMVQAIGEGTALLQRSGYSFDIPALFDLWGHGSVIRGWLVELAGRALRTESFDELSAHVEDTGEGKWVVQLALDHDIWAPVITESELAFYRSRDPDSATAKMVALLRNAFGGHPLHRKDHGGQRAEPHAREEIDQPSSNDAIAK